MAVPVGHWHGVGLAVGLPLLAMVVAPPHDAPPPDDTAGELRPLSKFAAAWELRILTIAKLKLHISRVDEWPRGGGYSLHLDFPDGSPHGWRALVPHTEGMQNAMKLPHGCTIRVGEGGRQGEGLMKVMTHNFLGNTWPVAEDWSPVSILDDFIYAYEPDASPVAANARQNAIVIAGKRGSGKTTLEHRMTAQFARCRDAVVWMIDLNGGGIAWPWLDQYAKGNAVRPTVDAVAANVEQAVELAEAAVRIAKARKSAYAPLRISRGLDILPVSPEIPELIVIVDEGGETTKKSPRLSEALCELMRIGRAEAVNELASVLRATGDLLPKDILVQSGIKVGMRMENDAEYAHLLGWEKGLRAADLRGKGCAYTYRDDVDAAPVQIKTELITPEQIGRCSIATAAWRPSLDAVSVAAAGEWYGRRWAPHQPMLEALRTGDVAAIIADLERHATTPATAAAQSPGSASARPALETMTAAPGSAKAALIAALAGTPGQPAPASQPPPATPGSAADPRPEPTPDRPVDLNDPAAVDAEAARLLTALDPDPTTPRVNADTEGREAVPQGGQTTTRARIVAVLDAVYPQALTGAQIITRLRESGHKVSDARIYDLLKAMAPGEIEQRDGGYAAHH